MDFSRYIGKKVHKPSFDKMIPMFREVATSYYETVQELLMSKVKHNTSLDQVDVPVLIQTEPISADAIAERKLEAMNMYANTPSLIDTIPLSSSYRVTKELWVDILMRHEYMIGQTPSYRTAESMLPWYLMRVITYLDDNDNAKVATDEIQQQSDLAVRQWNYEATHH